MNRMPDTAAAASIQAAARALHLPTVRAQADELAEAATRTQASHRAYLAELLAAEVDERAERRRIRRTREAHFPRLKVLDDFDTSDSPIEAATIATLAAGDFIEASRPCVLLGDSETG